MAELKLVLFSDLSWNRPGPFFVFSRDVQGGTTGAQPKPTSRADKLDPTKKRQHTFTGNYCNPKYGLKVFPSVGVYRHHWLNTSSFLELGVPNSRTMKDELRSQTFFCSFFQLTAVMEYLWTPSDHSGRNLLDPSEEFKINIRIRGTKVCPYTSICIYHNYILVYMCIKNCNIHVYLHRHTQNKYHTVTISNSYPHRSISIPRSPARPDALDSPFVDVSLGG